MPDVSQRDSRQLRDEAAGADGGLLQGQQRLGRVLRMRHVSQGRRPRQGAQLNRKYQNIIVFFFLFVLSVG
jgi:hypothetical protein